MSPLLLRLIVLLIASAAPLFAATYEIVGHVPSSTTALAPTAGSKEAFIVAVGSGGKYDCGELRMLQDRRTKHLLNFTGYNGKSPSALLNMRRNIYGITAEGGRNNEGTLFRLRGTRLQTLVQFDETTGAAKTLHAHGATLYGTCANGAFTLRRRNFQFFPLPLAADVAMLNGQLYATRFYYNNLYQLTSSGSATLQSDFPDSIIAGKKVIFATTSYGGLYREGSVRIYTPATNSLRPLVDFQSYNGGNPNIFVALDNGKLFAGNAEGIWQVGAHPKLLQSVQSLRFLNTDGRRLFGGAGYSLGIPVFVITP